MPLLGGVHCRAAFRFSVPKDHAVIRSNLTPDSIAQPSTMKSVEAAVTQSFHLFGAFAGLLPVRPRMRRPVFQQGSA
jgi:hypothetical protein